MTAGAVSGRARMRPAGNRPPSLVRRCYRGLPPPGADGTRGQLTGTAGAGSGAGSCGLSCGPVPRAGAGRRHRGVDRTRATDCDQGPGARGRRAGASAACGPIAGTGAGRRDRGVDRTRASDRDQGPGPGRRRAGAGARATSAARGPVPRAGRDQGGGLYPADHPSTSQAATGPLEHWAGYSRLVGTLGWLQPARWHIGPVPVKLA
jgi:hypothetical protein